MPFFPDWSSLSFIEQAFYFSMTFAVIVWSGMWVFDFILVQKGILPKKSETTIEDVKRLRDQGREGWAVRRFQQMPENKGLYTSKGADKLVEEL
ncbi:hypothetical protein A9Q99_22375 [Gammaproteobacteria bacterium 45_16_T64]|nr:hypothetical protein A9Q99_22375 [Gammaproteobacteria bacterium 45_16_T64]